MTLIRVLPFLFLLYCCSSIDAQGGLEHIKNQEYLKFYDGFDCDNIPDEKFSTLTEKICANLKLQEKDSILIVYYDSLQQAALKFGGESLVSKIDSAQLAWRNFRDEHSTIIWNSYEGCGGCNTRAAHYMNSMRLLTEVRIESIRQLLAIYRREQF